jgi:hypothetical protein
MALRQVYKWEIVFFLHINTTIGQYKSFMLMIFSSLFLSLSSFSYWRYHSLHAVHYHQWWVECIFFLFFEEIQLLQLLFMFEVHLINLISFYWQNNAGKRLSVIASSRSINAPFTCWVGHWASCCWSIYADFALTLFHIMHFKLLIIVVENKWLSLLIVRLHSNKSYIWYWQ